MDFNQLNGQSWYLAQYVSGGKNRETLFNWLNSIHITPWTPLSVREVRRADKVNCSRKVITPLFPGYFFLKANLETQSVSKIRCHSAFCGFVMNGSTIAPLKHSVVEGLMKLHPDPALNPNAEKELTSASNTWLTKAQYNYLVSIEKKSQQVSRVALLMKLVFDPELQGF